MLMLNIGVLALRWASSGEGLCRPHGTAERLLGASWGRNPLPMDFSLGSHHLSVSGDEGEDPKKTQMLGLSLGLFWIFLGFDRVWMAMAMILLGSFAKGFASTGLCFPQAAGRGSRSSRPPGPPAPARPGRCRPSSGRFRRRLR